YFESLLPMSSWSVGVSQLSHGHVITPVWVHHAKSLKAAVHAAQTPVLLPAVTFGCATALGQQRRCVTPRHHQAVHHATAALVQQRPFAVVTPAVAATLASNG